MHHKVMSQLNLPSLSMSVRTLFLMAGLQILLTHDSLTRVSHIHLFGIAFIFTLVGFIFSLAVGINAKLKAFIIVIPYAFLIVDILSW